MLRALRTGQFDLGLTGMTAPDEDLVFTPFYQDAMVLIAPNTPEFFRRQGTEYAACRALAVTPAPAPGEWQRQPAFRR